MGKVKQYFGRVAEGTVGLIMVGGLILWTLAGLVGVISAWGAIAGIMSAFLGLPLLYGVYYLAVHDFGLPIWAGLLLAIPPNLWISLLFVVTGHADDL